MKRWKICLMKTWIELLQSLVNMFGLAGVKASQPIRKIMKCIFRLEDVIDDRRRNEVNIGKN